MRNGIIRWFVAVGAFFVANVGLALPEAASRPESYMRIVRAEKVVNLEIAARAMVPDGRAGPTIWLTGVSHVGEHEYFGELQKHLDAMDLVLYEGVGDSPRLMKRLGMKQPKGLQDHLAEALDLEFQLDAVNYGRKHFLNCDVSVAQLQAMMQLMAAESKDGEQAQNELTDLLSMMQGKGLTSVVSEGILAWLQQNQNLKNTAKLMFIEVLGSMKGDLGEVDAPGSVKKLMELLIDERNKVVIKSLQKQLFLKNPPPAISIFYGAGHMHDLQERISDELGYVASDEIWFTAMSLNVERAGFRPSDLRLIRRIAEVQMGEASSSSDQGASTSN